MKTRFMRFALSGLACTAILGCSNQTAAAPTVLFPQAHSGQRPAPDSFNQNLLYVGTSNRVLVYSYPKAKPHGTLTYFQAGEECADNVGDVFIATIEQFVEYPHDGENPIGNFVVLGATECSADPLSGDLAIATEPAVYIYRHTKKGWLLPAKRVPPFTPYGVGYDNNGNLFVDGSTSLTTELAELPAGSRTFEPITLSQQIEGPGQIQWDGQNLVIEDTKIHPSTLYRFSITGSTAVLAGSTILESPKPVQQYWIAGQYVVGSSNGRNVFFWRYPAGGSPVKKLSLRGFGPYGVTVSVPPRRLFR